MSEEIENKEQEINQESNQIYLEAIQKLKSETVSIDEYNKLKDDNKNLLNAMLEGQTTTVDEPKKKPTAEESLENMQHAKNDIDYVQNALNYREAILAETGEDCFVPRGHNYTISEDAYKSAQRTADVFQQCIDYANGDNALFINELQRRTNDIRLPARKK